MKNNDPRALNTVKSWLTACGISYRTGRWPEADLVVQNAAGKEVGVSVIIKGSPVAKGSIVVIGADITHRDLRTSLEAFQALQLALGFEAQAPVDRGPIPERRPYGDDFDLVAMRHSEFRRTPNPSAEKLKTYLPTAEKACWKFYRANQRLCADQMLAVEDLKTFALVWTTNYCGLYEIPAERATNHDNERLLFTYLTQRFAEFRTNLIRKGRNELPSLDAAFIATRGRPYNGNMRGLNPRSWMIEDERLASAEEYSEVSSEIFARVIPRRWVDEDRDEEEDVEYVARHRQLDVSTPNTRRASAVKLLEALLTDLPHDKLVEKLTIAAESDLIHADARKEASRRLRAHMEKCSQCAELQAPVDCEDETQPEEFLA